MKKALSNSAACAAKCLYAICQEMKKRGGSIAAKDISDFVLNNVPLTDWEKERSGKKQAIRWWVMVHFFSVDYVKAGYILKKSGFWYLTPEGEEAMKHGAETMQQEANTAYRKWRKEQPVEKEEEAEEEDTEKEDIINLEQLEQQALDGITEFIVGKNPYEFQDMVAALLRAMGYYTPFVAPKGKDGGVDVIAYLDALGARTPRIKVQVKHYPTTAIEVKDIRSLIGVLREGDIGLFVTSGTFSASAKQEAQHSTTFVRLIDGNDFISLWQQHYDKMSDEDKNMLPLKRIAFLGTND